MARDSTAPGSCVDCGNDAYIYLAGESSGDMACAHCYVARRDAAKASRPQPEASRQTR